MPNSQKPETTEKTENPYLTNPDRNSSNVQRFNAGQKYGDAKKTGGNEDWSDRSKEKGYHTTNSYPSTKESTPEERQAWQGNPSYDSSYGGDHLDWESEDPKVKDTTFDRSQNTNSNMRPGSKAATSAGADRDKKIAEPKP
jgi:hypothetical protein